MGRTKGAKNKKTLLIEKKLQKVEINTDSKQEVVPFILEEPKERVALRLFTLEKKVHDDFIKFISQFGDPKLYESYIVNELMVKYLNGKIKLPKIDKSVVNDYMLAYGHVGFESGTVVEELSELKAANRLLHKPQNSFIQFQYPIIVDPNVKNSLMESPSFIINECLKLYIKELIKVDTRDYKIREWEPKYKSVLRKKARQDKI